jgi:hypothetical protein
MQYHQVASNDPGWQFVPALQKMKPRSKLSGLLVLLLAFGFGFGLLHHHSSLNRAKIAVLEQKLAALAPVRAENQELQKVLTQLQELEDLRQNNSELFRLRKTVRELQAAAERRKLAAARTLETRREPGTGEGSHHCFRPSGSGCG